VKVVDRAQQLDLKRRESEIDAMAAKVSVAVAKSVSQAVAAIAKRMA
jgi:hypothetical protein